LRKHSSDEEEKKPEKQIPKKLDPVAQNDAFKTNLEALLANKGANPNLNR